jgi:hypothetical protein
MYICIILYYVILYIYTHTHTLYTHTHTHIRIHIQAHTYIYGYIHYRNMGVTEIRYVGLVYIRLGSMS